MVNSKGVLRGPEQASLLGLKDRGPNCSPFSNIRGLSCFALKLSSLSRRNAFICSCLFMFIIINVKLTHVTSMSMLLVYVILQISKTSDICSIVERSWCSCCNFYLMPVAVTNNKKIVLPPQHLSGFWIWKRFRLLCNSQPTSSSSWVVVCRRIRFFVDWRWCCCWLNSCNFFVVCLLPL